MRAASTVLSLSFAAGLMATGTVQALGFGRVVNATQLGQRLNFGALVRLDADESLDRSCVFAEVSAGDSLLQPGQVRVTLENGPDRGERTVRVSTSTVIDEPVVSVNLTLGCNDRSSRRFVVFIDPPGLPLAPAAAATDAALLLPQRDDSQIAPLIALLAPEPPRRPAARRRDTSVDRDHHRQPSAPTVAAAARSRPTAGASPAAESSRILVSSARKPANAARRTAVADRPPASARLQLEAPTPPLPVAAAASAVQPAGAAVPAVAAGTAFAAAPSAVSQAALSTTAAAAGSAPAAAAPSDAAATGTAEQRALLQRERERVQLLEQGLARLQADAADTRRTVAALQTRLHQAEARRDANPWVYALGALSAVLAALLAAVVWRRRHPEPAVPWWKVGVAASIFGRHSVLAGSTSSTLAAPSSTLAVPESRSPAPVDGDDRPVTAVDPSSLSATGPGFASRSAGPSGVVTTAAPPKNEPPAVDSPSVEELIDLEQQVEFFMVLGQDDAAIDLLAHHLQADGATSPLPYLKLLEIHRRRGDRAGYETTRDQFNRDFNAYAPDWDADPEQGRALEDYPEVVDHLQRDWGSPARAMELLEAALFHRGPSQITFDLPAYRELLSLYSIARDHQAQQGGAAAVAGPSAEDVDLLLPLGHPSPAVAPIAWLKATTKPAARLPIAYRVSSAPLDVDVDVSLPAGPEERAPVRAPISATPVAAVQRMAPMGPRPMPAKVPLAVSDENLETVPSALRRPDGHPDESVFVDLVLEPIEVSLR